MAYMYTIYFDHIYLPLYSSNFSKFPPSYSFPKFMSTFSVFFNNQPSLNTAADICIRKGPTTGTWSGHYGHISKEKQLFLSELPLTTNSFSLFMLEIWLAWSCAALIQVTSAAWSQTLLHSCLPQSAALSVCLPFLPRVLVGDSEVPAFVKNSEDTYLNFDQLYGLC